MSNPQGLPATPPLWGETMIGALFIHEPLTSVYSVTQSWMLVNDNLCFLYSLYLFGCCVLKYSFFWNLPDARCKFDYNIKSALYNARNTIGKNWPPLFQKVLSQLTQRLPFLVQQVWSRRLVWLLPPLPPQLPPPLVSNHRLSQLLRGEQYMSRDTKKGTLWLSGLCFFKCACAVP